MKIIAAQHSDGLSVTLTPGYSGPLRRVRMYTPPPMCIPVVSIHTHLPYVHVSYVYMVTHYSLHIDNVGAYTDTQYA